jgi:hypothetical protein
MFITLNMGLHDHSPGKGVRIPSTGLADNAVTSAKIAANAVTADKIPDGSLTQQELATNSVGQPQLQDSSVGNAELQDGAVGLSKLDPSVVPIGTVISWYRPTPSVPIPAGGWEVCDGRPWSDITNAWGQVTGTIPDLRGKFILGAGLTNIGPDPTKYPDIGQLGGSHTKNLTHSHVVNSHSHGVPTHNHSITSDGDHTHAISIDGLHNHSMHSRLNALLQGIEVYSWDSSDNPIRRQNNLQSLYVAGFNNSSSDDVVPSTGSHSHGGATGSAGGHSHGGTTGSWTGSTDSQAPGTSDALSSMVDIRPAYVGLIYLMRVR